MVQVQKLLWERGSCGGACRWEAMVRAFEVAEEMEFIVAGSSSEYTEIFKCCGKGEKI